MAKESKLIGKKVDIKDTTSWAYGEWGTVTGFDGEYYYVAIADDRDTQLIFQRSDIRVRRSTK